MKISIIVTMVLAGAALVGGAVFVLQGTEREGRQVAQVEVVAQNQEEEVAAKDGVGPKLFSPMPLPLLLNPAWPEEIAFAYNPCANLQVPPEIRVQTAGLREQKEKAERFRQEILAKQKPPVEIFRGDQSRKTVAFTIDTGTGGEEGIEQILELGRHYGISFTFFLTGCWVLENPELTQEMARKGHSIANHTLTHLNLALATDAQARREIGETQLILQEVLGWEPVLFRKPQYAGGDRITQLAGEYGMVSVQGWPDFGDTTGWRSGTTAQDVVTLVKRKTAPGAIWVLHNLSLADLHALEEIIRFHLAEGYEILSVEELLLQ